MKAQQLIAKERSFVMKLTKQDIQTILHKCGYTINQNAQDQTGKILPPIEKFYNCEKNEYQLMIRVKHAKDNNSQLYNAMASKIPTIVSLDYNPNISIVFLTDFSFLELSVFDEETNNQTIYAQFMYHKFGEYYREKYNHNVRKEIKHEKQEHTK